MSKMALSFRFSNIRVIDTDSSSDDIEEEEIAVLSKLIGKQFRYSDPAKLKYSLGRHDTIGSDSEQTSENEMEGDWVADFHSVLDMQKTPIEKKELLKSCQKNEFLKEHVTETSPSVKESTKTDVKELNSVDSNNQEDSDYEDTIQYQKINKQIPKSPSLSHEVYVSSSIERNSTSVFNKDNKENKNMENPQEYITGGKLETLVKVKPENKEALLMTKSGRRASRINELKEKFEVLNKKLNITYVSKVHVTDKKSEVKGRGNLAEKKVKGPQSNTVVDIQIKVESGGNETIKNSTKKKAETKEYKAKSMHTDEARTISEPISVDKGSVHKTLTKSRTSTEKITSETHSITKAEKTSKKEKQFRDNLPMDVTNELTNNESCISSVIKAIVKDAKSPVMVKTSPVSVSKAKMLNLNLAESVPLPSPKISAISKSSCVSNVEPDKQVSPISMKHNTKEKRKPRVYDIQPACSFPLDDLLPAVKASLVKTVVETTEKTCDNLKPHTNKEYSQSRGGCVENVQSYPYVDKMTSYFPERFQDNSTNMDSVPMDCDSELDRYNKAAQDPYHEEVSYGHTNPSAAPNFWPQPSVQSFHYASNQYPGLSHPAFNAGQGCIMGPNNPWAQNYQMTNPFPHSVHNLPYSNQSCPLQQNINYGTSQMPQQDNQQPTDPLNSVLLAMKYSNDVAIQKLQAALCEQIRAKHDSSVSTNGSDVDNSFGFYKERSSSQLTTNETFNSRDQSGRLFQLFVEQVSGLVKTEDDRSKVKSLLEVLKKEGGDKLRGTGFTPPQLEQTHVVSCEDICEPSGEDSKSDIVELFEGRTLLKGGVKARHIPKTTVYKTDKANPKDPRLLPGKLNAVTSIKLPAFFATVWQTKPEELKKETSIPFNAKDPRCQKLLSENPQKLGRKTDKTRTPDSQQSNSNASDNETLEKVLENLKQLDKQVKDRSKSDDKSDKEENENKASIMSKSTLVRPVLEQISNKLKSPPKPMTVTTGLSQISTTSEECSQESSIPVVMNKSTSEPVWKPNLVQINERGSFLQDVKIVEVVETNDTEVTKPLQAERKLLPFEMKKQTKPSVGIVKPVQQVRNDSKEQRSSANNDDRGQNMKSKPVSSKGSTKDTKAKSSIYVKRSDQIAKKYADASKSVDISYSDISDEEQLEDSAPVLTIGEVLRQKSKHTKTITKINSSRRSPGNDKTYKPNSYEQRPEVKPTKPEKHDKTRRSRSGSSDRHYKVQKRSHSRSPALKNARHGISGLQTRHYQGSSGRQPSPTYVTSVWHKDQSSLARQQHGLHKRPSHSPQESRVEQPRKRHDGREKSKEKSEMAINARERELEELERYRDYLLQKSLDIDPDEDRGMIKCSSNKEYSRHSEEYRSIREHSRHNKENNARKEHNTHSEKYSVNEKVSTQSEEFDTSKEHASHSEDRSIYEFNQLERKELRRQRYSEERSRKEVPRQQELSVESQCSDSSRKRQHVSRGDSFHLEEKVARIDKPATQPMKADLRNKLKKRPDKSRGPNYSTTVNEYFMSSFYKQMENSNAGAKVSYEHEFKDSKEGDDGNLSDDDFKKEYLEIFTKPKTYEEPSVLKGTTESNGKKLKTGLSKEKTAKQLKQEEEDRLFLENCRKKFKKFDEISPETAGMPKRSVADSTPVKVENSNLSARGTLDYSDMLKLTELEDGQIS